MASLRRRMALGAGLIALVATGLPGLWLSWRAYNALRDESHGSQLSLARTLASEIDAQLSGNIGIVEALAARPSALKDIERLNQRLALLASAAEDLDDLAIFQPNGKLVARATRMVAPPVISARDIEALVQAALAGPANTVSQVRDGSENTMILRLGRRMGRGAVAVAQMRLDEHGLGSLETLNLGKDGFAYLVDESGRPLLLPTLAGRARAKDALLNVTLGGAPYVQDEAGREGRDILAVAPVESLSWAVALRRPAAEVEASARRMRSELVVFVVLAVLGSLLLAWTLARPLISGLGALNRAARRMEGGDLEPRELEAWQQRDELGQVASAMAHMAGALKAQGQAREAAHTRALAAEKRLAQSERLASLGQLAAGLAHELNSPLMVIKGAADEALGSSASKARPWIERVRRESDRCARLVRELLDYARPKSPRRRQFDLRVLVKEALESSKAGRGANYRLAMHMPKPQVRADRDQMFQVLRNLFSNAMDAMPEGGEIQVSLGSTQDQWTMTVRDHGPGVPPRQREAIFRPFFTRKAGGTGLGLAIARNLMVGHGGRLRCLGGRGGGARFVAEWKDGYNA